MDASIEGTTVIKNVASRIVAASKNVPLLISFSPSFCVASIINVIAAEQDEMDARVLTTQFFLYLLVG